MDAGSATLVLAETSAGTPVWLTPVIAGAAAILAATVTGLASAYAAKRKAAELKLSNSFDLAKQYLESARNYTETVYMPLSISTYKLYSEFLAFKAADTESAHLAENRFREGCQAFIDTIDDLFLRGAAAVLTLRTDEAVTRFTSFLRESLASTSGKVIKVNRRPPIRQMLIGAIRAGFEVGVAGAASPLVSLALPDITGEVSSVIAAAPVTSEDFERQFVNYIEVVKAGIKEVTLGGYKDKDG